VKSVLQGKLFSMYITQKNLNFFLPLRLFWDPSNNGCVSTPFPRLRFPIVPPQHPLTPDSCGLEIDADSSQMS